MTLAILRMRLRRSFLGRAANASRISFSIRLGDFVRLQVQLFLDITGSTGGFTVRLQTHAIETYSPCSQCTTMWCKPAIALQCSATQRRSGGTEERRSINHPAQDRHQTRNACGRSTSWPQPELARADRLRSMARQRAQAALPLQITRLIVFPRGATTAGMQLKEFLPFAAGIVLGLGFGFSVCYVGSRYQLSSSEGGYGSTRIPVFVKFDRWSGATWISVGQSGTWRPFTEAVTTNADDFLNSK